MLEHALLVEGQVRRDRGSHPEDKLTDEEVELLYQDQLAKLRGKPADEPTPVVVPGSQQVN